MASEQLKLHDESSRSCCNDLEVTVITKVQQGSGSDGHMQKSVKSDLLLREALLTEKVVPPSRCQKIQGAILPVVVLVIIIGLVVMLFIINSSPSQHGHAPSAAIDDVCHDPCRLSVVESIPEGLNFSTGPLHTCTFDAWMSLISNAEATIDIASFYWSLRPQDVYNDSSGAQGQAVFDAIVKAGTSGKIKVRVVQDVSQDVTETNLLLSLGVAEVRKLNMTAVFGAGVLHTKFIVVDSKHFYVGSANMDWRSLTQVKELGAATFNCSCLASDLLKVFSIYWLMGVPNASIPSSWPANLDTTFNATRPLNVSFDGTSSTANVYFSSSPPPFSTPSRADDAETIVDAISKAESSVCVAVMDYSPTTEYLPYGKNIFWPTIDDAFRRAAFERKVTVRLLASLWVISARPTMLRYLNSLAAFSDRITIKLFVVPSNAQQALIPFARVNHNKYMVTDRVAYIGTSNWAGDYFINTAGVGFVANETSQLPQDSGLRAQLQAVFDRDWTSPYAMNLTDAKLLLLK